MTAISFSTCFSGLILLIFHFGLLAAGQSSSFSFQSFSKDPNFDSNFALYGDARVVNNGSVLQLTHSVSSSAGRVVYKEPIKLVEGNPVYLVSFSSYLSFFLSPNYGDGLAFFMVSGGVNFSEFGASRTFGFSSRSVKNNAKFVAVELDTKIDSDLNGSVGINVVRFTSVKVENASSINLILSNGKRLSCWIDYEASSKRLEVRLSEFGNTKPIDPLLSYPIDLSKLWEGEKIYIGLSLSNGNSTQSQGCLIYSWSFEQRHVPHWMHSQPLDPQAFVKGVKPVGINKPSNCFLRVIAAMIFGTACGALGAFIMLYLWAIFGNRRPVVPEECSMDFDYKKVKVVVEKAVQDGKN